MAEQELVSLVEGGSRDGLGSEECKRVIMRISQRVKELSADTLILGCTHFSHLEGELKRACGVRVISPAREGALALARATAPSKNEIGRITYM
jgi:glutamate racemase